MTDPCPAVLFRSNRFDLFADHLDDNGALVVKTDGAGAGANFA